MATTDVSQYNGLLAQKKRLRRRAEFKKLLPLYLMMLPGLIYLICNNYLPMFGILIAFKQVNFSIGILQSDWVGFQNFEFLFKTKDAWTMIRNTICYNVVFIALGLVISIAIAILMAEISSRKIAKVMCHREGLYQIDLMNGSKNRVTDREYWAQKKGQAALDRQNAPMIAGGITPRQTKFETNKEKLRQIIRKALATATGFDEFFPFPHVPLVPCGCPAP